jgi:hypothetical protein
MQIGLGVAPGSCDGAGGTNSGADGSSTSVTPWWIPLVQTGVMTAEQVVATQTMPPPTMNFPYPGSTFYPSGPVSSITSSALFWPAVLVGAFLLFRRKR